MRGFAWSLAVFVLPSVGCKNESLVTPVGAVLAEKDLSSKLPASVGERPVTRWKKSLPVGEGNDATVAIEFDAVEDPGSGTLYLRSVRVAVERNGRYTLAASCSTDPSYTNDSSGRRTFMTQMANVSWVWKDGAKAHIFTVVADGQVRE